MLEGGNQWERHLSMQHLVLHIKIVQLFNILFYVFSQQIQLNYGKNSAIKDIPHGIGRTNGGVYLYKLGQKFKTKYWI